MGGRGVLSGASGGFRIERKGVKSKGDRKMVRQ